MIYLNFSLVSISSVWLGDYWMKIIAAHSLRTTVNVDKSSKGTSSSYLIIIWGHNCIDCDW